MSFMTETRVAMQNFNDHIEQFENANPVQSLSTPPYVSIHLWYT